MSIQPEKPWGAWLFKLFAFSGHPKLYVISLRICVSISIGNPPIIFKNSYFSDPYVKVWLMFGDKRVEKKKTPIYKCNLNPIFNASFEFDVPWEQIRDCAIDVQVMDFDTIGRNELIGKILLACKLRIRCWRQKIALNTKFNTKWVNCP